MMPVCGLGSMPPRAHRAADTSKTTRGLRLRVVLTLLGSGTIDLTDEPCLRSVLWAGWSLGITLPVTRG
jgi:hypothetical protein